MATTIDIQSCFSYFLIWLISTLLVRFFLKKYKKTTIQYLSLPPSPPSLPIIGHIHHLSLTLYKSFHKLCCRYGPLLYLRVGSKQILLVSSASMVTEIFKSHDIDFASRPRSNLPDTFLFGDEGFAFAPYGDYWRFMKKFCVTELLGTRQLERSRTVRREELVLLLSKIFEKAKRKEVVDVGAGIMTLTNNSTCRMVMSTRCSGEDNQAEKVRELMSETTNLLAKTSFVKLLGPFSKLGLLLCRKQKLDVIGRFDELFEGLLSEHEEKARRDGGLSSGDKDMMDLLLEVDHDEDAEFRISRFNMKAFFLDIFFAGTSSTAETMQWAFASLINHPTVIQKVREEIESVVGRNRLVEEFDIPNLHYLQAVVKEALRLFPGTTLISRISSEDCRIGGFDVPKGTTTYINVYSILRDPKVWDDPDNFHPERFLNLSNGEADQMRQDFSYIPFGGGRRMCPGMNLALCMLHTTIAALVQCFDWKAVGDEGKVNMQAKPGLFMVMAQPLLCLPGVRYYPFPA